MYSLCKFESVRIAKTPSLVKADVKGPSGRTLLKPPLLYYCPLVESRKWKKKNGRKICGFVSFGGCISAINARRKPVGWVNSRPAQ